MLRGGEVASRLAHTQKIIGSNPISATKFEVRQVKVIVHLTENRKRSKHAFTKT